MAAAQKTLADLICEGVLPERYQPNHLRKRTGKTRPMGGGRIPLLVERWESFDEEVRAWWTEKASRHLTQVDASQTYPEVLPLHGVISKEDGVRAALQLCIFEPVNEALSRGLGLNFLLNETESIACVRSNVDWGGFLIERNQDDMFVRIALPVEVKPPWQFKLSAGDGHVVDLLRSLDTAQRDKVRFVVAQIYLYMILEEAEFGVLCSKEQYIFLRRLGRPEDKVLQISRTFQCEDEVGVRRCLLYICDLALWSLTMPKAAVDVAGPTPLAMKLVTPPGQRRDKKRKKREPDRSGVKKKFSRSFASCVQARDADEWTPLKAGSKPLELPYERVNDWEPPMLSAQASMEPTSWRRESDCKQGSISWFQKLAEFDIFSLKLGKVLSSAGKVIVREGSVWGAPTAIKMFDFIDGNELLQEFHNEVQAYQLLESLQGQAVPRILAYGSLWGHYMGFLALTLEGQAPCFQSQPHLIEEAKKSLKLIHAANVLHGDVAFRNMVLSAMGKIMFIDFGRCLTGVDEESCLEELEDLEELLNESL